MKSLFLKTGISFLSTESGVQEAGVEVPNWGGGQSTLGGHKSAAEIKLTGGLIKASLLLHSGVWTRPNVVF